MNKEIFEQKFNELKVNFIEPEINGVYSDIADKTSNVPIEKIANQITILESKNADSAVGKIEDEIRNTIKSCLGELNYNSNDIIITESKVMNSVDIPTLQLCNNKDFDFDIGMGIPEKEEVSTVQALNESKGKYIAASGIALEVLAWIFIPSLSVWSPIIKGIGLVLTVAGAVYTAKEIADCKKKTVSTEELIPAQNQQEQINELCENQCKLNKEILFNWADEVCNALNDECAEDTNCD